MDHKTVPHMAFTVLLHPSPTLFIKSSFIYSSKAPKKSSQPKIHSSHRNLRSTKPWLARILSCLKPNSPNTRIIGISISFFFLQIMEAVPDQDTSICTHCDRAIPVANIDLHYAHCSRKLEKCKICGDMVPRKNAEDHYLNTHAPVSCSLCSETMERDILDIHKGENCPQRIVTCEFCEFPLPAIDLAEHQEVCGNRTELCHICNKYVRLRERFSHEARCNGIIQDSSVGSSRNVREAEGDQGARRRPQNDFSTKRLLFTIAITGIAVILGSFFLQRKAEPSDVH